MRLLTLCYGLLERAERSVAVLTGLDAQGNPVTAPFDATATIEIEKAMKSAVSTSSGSDGSLGTSTLAPKPNRSRRVKPTIGTGDRPVRSSVLIAPRNTEAL